MSEAEAFNAGALCGYGHGTGRAGVYVLGEEFELSWEAAASQNIDLSESRAWLLGYRKGYLLAAEGSEL